MQINSHKHAHIHISKYLKKNNNNKRFVEGDCDLDSGQGKGQTRLVMPFYARSSAELDFVCGDVTLRIGVIQQW